jgi:hypothetical protein
MLAQKPTSRSELTWVTVRGMVTVTVRDVTLRGQREHSAALGTEELMKALDAVMEGDSRPRIDDGSRNWAPEGEGTLRALLVECLSKSVSELRCCPAAVSSAGCLAFTDAIR